MSPVLQRKKPMTVRVGDTTNMIRDAVLKPMLLERHVPMREGCVVFEAPSPQQQHDTDTAVFISLDVLSDDDVVVAAQLTSELRACCTTCVVFTHPLHAG